VNSVLPAERPCGVLAVGARPDDTEIGCSGYAEAFTANKVTLTWLN
jgi:hypothetical protein